MKIQKSKVSLVLAGALSLSSPIMAQETEPQETEQGEVEKAERIQVTGSRIKRMDVEGTTPITVITREDIEMSGVNSLDELVRKSTSSPVGNFAGTGGFVRSGASTVNLLGLGANRTLVLLDGKRLPVDVSVGAVNLGNIPLALIERIEIVSGGQSAVYGADAVGGVMNVITRKGFEGNEVTVNASVPENGGGEAQEISAVSGVRVNEDLSLAFTAGYKQRNKILATNRDFVRGVAPRDFTATNPPYGEFSWRNLSTDREWRPSPNCPDDRQKATVPSQPDNVYCAGPRSETRGWLTPNYKEWYLTARAEWEIDAKSRLSTLGYFSENKSEYQLGNYLTTINNPFTGRGLLLDGATAKSKLGIEGVADGNVIELYSKAWEFEDRYNNNSDQSYGVSSQYEYLGDSWDVSASVSAYRSTNTRDFLNVINKKKSVALLFEDENGSPLINPEYLPFGEDNDVALLNSIHDDLKASEFNDSLFIDTVFSRDLTELPGGMLSFATGLSFQREYYNQTPSDLDTLPYIDANGVELEPLYEGTASTKGRGGREVYSAFAELLTPVTNDLYFDLAARYDQYSDFGGTFNYAAGSFWKLAESFALRGNTSTSYKAPQLDLVNAISGGGYSGFRDDLWCQRERERGNVCEEGGGQNIYVDRVGNKDIREEVGRSYNVGFVYEPLKNLSIVSDYYGIFVKDRHGLDRLQQIADDFYEGKGEQIGENQSKVGANIITWEESVVGGQTEKVITSIDTPWTNLGTIETYAFEVKMNGYVDFTENYRLGLNSSLFRYLSYKTQDYPNEPSEQDNGYKGTPKWRMRNDLGLTFLQNQRVNLGVSTIARQFQDPEVVIEGRDYFTLSEYSEWDLSYSLSMGNTRLGLGVNNVFDTIGGKDASGSVIGAEGTDTGLYSIQGRTWFARLSQRF